MAPRVFLITGTSTGFGKEYVQEVLNRGDIVVATARDPSSLKFSGTNSSNYLAIRLDVTDRSSIKEAFDATLEKFKRVDVVVNNAGYGLAGNFEEYTDDQIRQQMEINFFGLMDVTRQAMQVMRDRQTPQGGLIQQITSIGGQRGVPLFSVYCASKWAVEGFTEAVSLEVKPEWGIKFTCVEPGGFRTDWAGRSMTFADRHPAYDHMDAKERMTARHGNQAGDPPKGAKAMYELAVMKDPPLRCVIGTDAYAAIMNKIDKYEQNYKRFETLSNSTDVEGYSAPS
ncbi:hypothetical protein LTR10_022290 [Elasticomyces elasticus]|uniref:NAD(P)-binding protein n=1 Tax=Exophiala sideris TaxID=1016849 RepID=A0ABR0J2H6_9EURO|nr:hypothetical protein LTR10_022290 [Elasticomyces elasticus]KAK5024054.1 hypothetical protein LTS07_008788 [Exophiala sideris]KAK5029085.1 hypothetical protein LTR13_008956 [Exophiala sideris]KAK5054766.1 hypothetical protein LTR69_008673 [Exophiala sideris]KAK5178908.1 hypothetical protein LTR44_008737 [Eurotiomycetes sp. CCFEE 6388]